MGPSCGMCGGRGGEETNTKVVGMEDAVKMLVERLVRFLLPHRLICDESNFKLRKQWIIAQQVHTAVVLYNYYHRKTSPHLAFADAKRFFACAALSVGEDLLPYLSMVHERGNASGEKVRFSITDKAAMDACEIAEALDASRDSPNIAVWPVSKVAVILFNPTSKKCLVEYGHNTKTVWSFIEKEIDAEPANSRNKASASTSTSSGPYMLQQLAYSELEHRTGIKRSNLRVIDEDSAYSLSKKCTTTRVFILAYEEIMKSNLGEISLEELIGRMTGPIFTSDSLVTTSTVVDYYHILPYYDILSELLHRTWSSHSRVNDQLHSVIDGKSKMQTGTNRINKRQKNSKRKSKPSLLKYPGSEESEDDVIPTQGNDSPVLADVETFKRVIKPVNSKATTAAKSGLDINKKDAKKQFTSGNIFQDDVSTEAPLVDHVIKYGGLEGQTVEVKKKSVQHNPVEVAETSVRYNPIEVSKKSDGKSKMRKRKSRMSSLPKRINKRKRNNKRKSKPTGATYSSSEESEDDVIPTEENESPVLVDVETFKPVIKPVKSKATAAAKSDKDETKKQSTSGNISQDDVPTEAPLVDVQEKSFRHHVEVLETSFRHNHVEVPEKSVRHNLIEVSEKSGGITEDKNDHIFDTLQSIWKREDDAIYKQRMLEERNAQYDMDIQTILHEGEITPKVMSLIEKYKDTNSNMTKSMNSYYSGESGQTPSTKRRKLKEAILLHNPCQELDKICRGNNWILPRYTILPSVEAGMFHSTVRLTGMDFDMSVDGNQHMTPQEARSSAATNMILELHKKTM